MKPTASLRWDTCRQARARRLDRAAPSRRASDDSGIVAAGAVGSLTSVKGRAKWADQPGPSAGSELGEGEDRRTWDGREDLTMRRLTVGVCAGVLVLPISAALAQGDPENGEKVFNKCKTCHVADEEKNKIGPTLMGIFGRQAGSVEGFKYSDAMKESGITWDEATIDEYIANPKKIVPKGKMAFAGLTKEQDRADLIAYLKEVTAN